MVNYDSSSRYNTQQFPHFRLQELQLQAQFVLTAANDYVGVIIHKRLSKWYIKTTATTTSLAVSELNASTAYEFY
jgi:hypothetical protein